MGGIGKFSWSELSGYQSAEWLVKRQTTRFRGTVNAAEKGSLTAKNQYDSSVRTVRKKGLPC
jgi:hypothetical protein